MDYPITRFKWAARVQCFGKNNGWSSYAGQAWLPTDVSVRFAYCSSSCRRRSNCWYFLPVRGFNMRDRGERCFRFCSEYDVPELLRKMMKSPGYCGKRRNASPMRRCKKDPRVGGELQALAAGCLDVAEFNPLIDFLIELGQQMPDQRIPTADVAVCIARWEWPFA